jgi:predicted DNA-binding protein with PD1-like motif
VKTAVLDPQGPKTNLLVFDPDEEVMDGLVGFVEKKAITAGHFTAIGAVSRAVLGFFDRKTKDYKRIPRTGRPRYCR